MPLLEPKPGKLRPHTAVGSSIDRVPDDQASGSPEKLRDALVAELGTDKVLHEISDLVRYASDASPYRLVPSVVVIAESIDDVSTVLRYARENRRHVVFRAAGTSLNAQAQGELAESATAHEAAEVLARNHDAYLSANRTCEIGMEHVTGRP